MTNDYAPPYNIFNQTTTPENLININCSAGAIDVNVGNGSEVMYIWNSGYFYKNGWKQFPFVGTLAPNTTDWIIGRAAAQLPANEFPPLQDNYLVAYICVWTGSEWKCGCRNTQCPESFWNLQIFQNLESGTGDNISLNLTIPHVHQQANNIDSLKLKKLLISVFSYESGEMPIDKCYFGAVDAALRFSRQDFFTLGVRELAKAIVQGSLLGISTGSPLGDVFLKFGSSLLTSKLTEQTFSEGILISFTEITIGYILGLSAESWYSQVADIAINEISSTAVEKLFKKEQIKSWKGSGNNRNSHAEQIDAAHLTEMDMRAFYSPFTHFMTVIIDAECAINNSETDNKKYVLRFEVTENEHGEAETVPPLGSKDSVQRIPIALP